MFLLIGAVFVFLLMAAAGVGGFFWWKHRQKVALQQAQMAQQEAAMAEQQAQEAQPENQPSTTQEQPSQTVEPQAEPSAPTAEPSEQAANPPAEPAPVKKTPKQPPAPKQPKETPPPAETQPPSSTETAQAPVATEPPAESPKPAVPAAVNLDNAFGKPCGSNEQFVTGLYQSILERQPDQGGKTMWLGKLGSNTTREDIYRQFFSSQEYVARNKSDRQFVRDAYQAVLGREPDEAGMQLMLAKLQEKKTKRVDVINGLLSSAEYQGIMAHCK